MKYKVETQGKGWSRAGETAKRGSEPIVVEKDISIKDLIEEELKTLEFKRGVTYKMLAEKYDTTVNFVFKVRYRIN